MKNEDNMIDALLTEHARSGVGDDTEFLKELEIRLDEELRLSSVVSQQSAHRGRVAAVITGGVGIAAALTIAAGGYYSWKKNRNTDLALYDIHHVEVVPLDINDRAARTKSKLDKKEEDQLARRQFKEHGFGDLDEGEEGTLAGAFGSITETLDSGIPQESMMASEAPPSLDFEKVSSKSNIEIGEKTKALRVDGQRIISEPRFRKNSEIKPSNRREPYNKELYDQLSDNVFLSPWKAPLSTFSVDVDTASYANIRRMIQSGQSIPSNAVRIEEMINYFDYSYPQPSGKHPLSVHVETASCPWNTQHRLVKIGLQGKDIMREKRPAANLVFLLDVSGSMNRQDKLPLLVDSMKILLKQLNGDDSVCIVVYAGAEGLSLAPTQVDEDGRKLILDKLNNFHSGGSTNGGAGITLAYKMAKKYFVRGGVNRVILGTDGDFNVGLKNHEALISMVESEAKSGVDLSVLGFGQGNLNDAMLEDITNKGNGNYSYIDSLREGRKVLLEDMMGNLVTIAKDVKIQVEFNPAKVKSYRLIGYANRILQAEDFKNKRIDAGEVGAGHTVTALYEVIPGNATEGPPAVDELKYQKRNGEKPKPAKREVIDSPELMTVKLAYKAPEATKETESIYLNTSVIDSSNQWVAASNDFKFASSVALFGMLQRGSEYVGSGSYQLVRQLAERGRGEDEKGLRTEFSDLVRKVAE